MPGAASLASGSLGLSLWLHQLRGPHRPWSYTNKRCVCACGHPTAGGQWCCKGSGGGKGARPPPSMAFRAREPVRWGGDTHFSRQAARAAMAPPGQRWGWRAGDEAHACPFTLGLQPGPCSALAWPPACCSLAGQHLSLCQPPAGLCPVSISPSKHHSQERIVLFLYKPLPVRTKPGRALLARTPRNLQELGQVLALRPRLPRVH